MALFKKASYSPEDLEALLRDNGAPSIAQMAAATSGRAQAAQKEAAAIDTEAKKNEAAATATFDQAVAAARKALNDSMKTISAKRADAAQLRENAVALENVAKRFSK